MASDTQGNRTVLSAILVNVGLLAIMTATFLPLVRYALTWRGYIYAAGAVLLLTGRIVTPTVKGGSIRLQRMLRLEFWTALIFAVGAVFIFLPQAGRTDWLAFTLAGAALTVYTSIMIPRLKK